MRPATGPTGRTAGDGTAATATAELHRALQVLDEVIDRRLEERRADPDDRDRPLGSGDEGLPPVQRWSGTGPLATVVTMAGLTAAEALVLTAAIAPHVDERYAVRLGSLTVRPGVLGPTGEVARTLAARSFEGRLAADRMLSEHGTLRGAGLLLLDGDDLSGALTPEPALLAWLLGRPEPVPRASAEFPARPLTSVHTLDDVVVPVAVREQLDDLRSRLAHRERVVTEWGFGRHHDHAAGLVALLHGPPGTGKTMTAAVLAADAGLPAYLVDLSALVSKYIGETEKQLARVFDRAEREDCVLVFDEADAIFGARTEVTDSHDRYANQEVSYLLARVESHPGTVVLTTNLLGNIDTAFQRRIHVQIEMPAPGPAERRELWRRVLPPAVPRSDDLDLSALAERFPLTGAQIRDAALEAAYAAAAGTGVVTQDHLLAGVRRQFTKTGRSVPT